MSAEFAGRPQKVRDDELCGTARVRGGGGGDWSYTRGKTASEFSSRQQRRPHIGGASSPPTLGGRGHWTTLLLLLYQPDTMGGPAGWNQVMGVIF